MIRHLSAYFRCRANQGSLVLILFILSLFPVPSGHGASPPAGEDTVSYFSQAIRTLSDLETRRAGSPGEQKSAQFILSEFQSSGQYTVGIQTFSLPVRQKTDSRMVRTDTGKSVDLQPFISNAISPDTIGEEGITGHVIYAASGSRASFNHKPVKDAIVLMELDSGKDWINALSLGARAVVYIQRPVSTKFLFQDKIELTPVDFPRFVITEAQATELFGQFEQMHADAAITVRLFSDLQWVRSEARNVYCLIPGTNDALKEELIIVEGFYDSSEFIAGKSPGADQACSAATLLDLANHLRTTPPQRPVLLVATSGHASSLHGMRELIWTIDEKSRQFKKNQKNIEEALKTYQSGLQSLLRYRDPNSMTMLDFDTVKGHLDDVIKSKIDDVNKKLMQLRLEEKSDPGQIKELARNRMVLKQLGSKRNLRGLSPDESFLVKDLIPICLNQINKKLEDTQRKLDHINSAMAFRELIEDMTIQTVISLHLSSHGDGFGAFSKGWLYPLKPDVNRYSPYAIIDKVLSDSSKAIALEQNIANPLQDTLRPSLQKSWESFFKDTPPLGGEVSSLAGMVGISLVTTNDARRLWGTPQDTPDMVDLENAVQQSRFIASLISSLSSAETLIDDRQLPRNGFSTLKGRANFIRHGELFAEAPAPDSMILSFQGNGIYHSMVDESGEFFIKGVADKKHTLHKVILEGYKFDDSTGKTIWAVDKKKTTKERYRIKVDKRDVETDLIMFSCRQTTLANLLEPRTFKYMTKIDLFDARTDSPPLRYWYSRIDTRSSVLCSLFLEPGTHVKLTLSDTLLTKKLILTHADADHPIGTGYKIDSNPLITPTPYLAAKDMWMLLNPRINNLEHKGINNQKIRELRQEGNAALEQADHFLETRMYDQFFEASETAMALAARVYDHVEKTQKDVLYGVLFYIMLFVPFAFCLERFLFAFRNIYKRIFGFLCILLTLIIIIYNVHPAFELAYSPVVIILAFFIIGLSAMVSWILFNRFEGEMKRLQRIGNRGTDGEISLLKAFSASFFMGVSNLRRRKLRTMLTCITLTILTFTLMSFTSVKNIRQHFKLIYNDTASYQGLLLKQLNWTSLPEQAFNSIQNAMASEMLAAPRGWLETEDRTRTVKIPAVFQDRHFEANGLIGLSHQESDISGLAKFITRGRWFSPDDRHAVLLPERMAEKLGILDKEPGNIQITLWSIPFTVIGFFSGDAFDRFRDLDGESLTPVTFPDEVFQQTTEAEIDAMESGQDTKSFQTRYTHIPFDQTMIIPYSTLMSLGGSLKSVALAYHSLSTIKKHTFQMVDRFGLWLFSGEKDGVYVYNASDTLNYSGIPNIIIPILISVFIVLNTMIGSVYERKREIGIYTSIGMAPSHVSIIFIAEALSYAVLSVVTGYLLAQTVAKVFAGTALLNGITVNYSSMAGVFSMAMVILVVILSAIYPSRIAAAIAIPDVDRAWEMTKATGNLLKIDLPFLLKQEEEQSVRGFLYNFLSSHQEVSHGIFSLDSLKIKQTPGEKDPLYINFTAWLAPFDLGVMQDVTIFSSPSRGQAGFLELTMEINRKSGEHNTWWRVNKRFVNLVRKQLLVWRSLQDAEKESFKRLMDTPQNIKDAAIA